MRVLLQNAETKLYFINANEWTDDPLKATDFEEVEQAVQTYDTQDLRYAKIVLEPGSPAAWPQVLAENLKPSQAQR